jgi:hypothetical protein
VDTAGTTIAQPVATQTGEKPARWRNADFSCRWAAESASLFGSAIALLAIPHLDASVLQMGPLGAAGSVLNVQQWSLRQLVTPDHLQGRVTASHRFLVYGAYPLGALLGGLLGEALGLRPAIILCSAGGLLPPRWLFTTPIRTLREQPASVNG